MISALGLVADSVELTGVALALSFDSTEAVGGEPGQDRHGEPDGQGEDCPRFLIGDEGEEEAPACSADQGAPARAGDERDGGSDQNRQRGACLRRRDVQESEGNRDGSLEQEADQGHEPRVRSKPLVQLRGPHLFHPCLPQTEQLRVRGRNPSRCNRPAT